MRFPSHTRSTSPPAIAILRFTLFAKSTASSVWGWKTLRDVRHLATKPHLLLLHWWKVPHVTDDGPAGHHHQQVGGHRVLRAVPEGVAELGVIFDRDWIYRATDLEGSLLKLHHTGVVDAGA